MSVKNERVNSNVQRELSYILANEVKNPHIKFITITACDVTSDLSYAKVYFTTLGDIKETLQGLKSAKGFIRKTLADRIKAILPNVIDVELWSKVVLCKKAYYR
jgi:ribosome-binding factor A